MPRGSWITILGVLLLGAGFFGVFPDAAWGEEGPAPQIPGDSGVIDGHVPWDVWLEELRAEAGSVGISERTLTAALDGIRPLPRVIELDRAQPEFTLTFDEYLGRVVSSGRIERGQRVIVEHADLVAGIGKKFGIQPRFLVALWGIETDFGSRLGSFRVIEALATLAYDGRRSRYFRRELLDALWIVQEGSVDPAIMVGSWAGAMGQLQFMPSSIRRNWVDHDGDGRLDIWSSSAEAVASGANYLARSGWRDDQTWGRRVSVPEGLSPSLLGLKVKKRLSEWQALGVRRADGRDLPRRDLEASLIRADKDAGPYFLVYDNFRALLTWNRSNFFALAVGHLSDRLKDLEP